MPKDAYYFSHDANARSDPKIRQMRSVYHNDGYAFYFMLLEMMRSEENYKLSMQGKYVWNAFASELDTTAEKIQVFVEDCINEFKLFVSDGEYFWSESFLKRMQLKDEKSEKARKSAEARWKKNKKGIENKGIEQSQSESNANASKSDAIKESKVNEIKVNKDIYIAANKPIYNLYESLYNTFISGAVILNLNDLINIHGIEAVSTALKKAAANKVNNFGYIETILKNNVNKGEGNGNRGYNKPNTGAATSTSKWAGITEKILAAQRAAESTDEYEEM